MVRPADVITLEEAKGFLKISTTTDDDELKGFISSATGSWVKRVGPVKAQEFVDHIALPRPGLALHHGPVLSVEAVLVDGVLIAESQYHLDPEAGVLEFDGGLSGRRAVVTYTAGYADDDVPADIVLGVKLLLRHLWRSQRGAAKAAGGGEDATTSTFLWPNRVEEIARDYRWTGFA